MVNLLMKKLLKKYVIPEFYTKSNFDDKKILNEEKDTSSETSSETSITVFELKDGESTKFLSRDIFVENFKLIMLLWF